MLNSILFCSPLITHSIEKQTFDRNKSVNKYYFFIYCTIDKLHQLATEVKKAETFFVIKRVTENFVFSNKWWANSHSIRPIGKLKNFTIQSTHKIFKTFLISIKLKVTDLLLPTHTLYTVCIYIQMPLYCVIVGVLLAFSWIKIHYIIYHE